MGDSLSLRKALIPPKRPTNVGGSDNKNWFEYMDRMLGELDPLVDVEHYRRSR